MKEVYCAIDLGATSGRIIVTDRDAISRSDKKLPDENQLQEISRFSNAMYERQGMFFWNTDALWNEIQKGLRLLAGREDLHVVSIGVDSWGCDVVFLDSNGQALAHPRAYRDPYTNGMMEKVWKRMAANGDLGEGQKKVYQKTGIQMLPFNTLYQLYACFEHHYEPFEKAVHYLWIADYFNYLLTGEMRNEYTLLSTSQLLSWYDNGSVRPHLDDDLLAVCGAKRECFAPMVQPGERIGLLRKEITPFAYDIPVIAVASHDTASAVATVLNRHIAYLSSGTWSLMGVVAEQPVITDDSYRLNFTNEGGVGQTARVLKNITGMWILEQCRREWKEQGKDYSHARLIEMAEQIDKTIAAGTIRQPLLFNPDEPRFANPASMLREVMNAMGNADCSSDLQDALIVWTIYHSLATRYGEVFRMLQQLTPWRIEQLYIIGGGARNTYLNRLTEQAVGVPVAVGSTEATAVGNILVQANQVTA
ncbi:MAG: rhamnulokinase [Paludibacteraceae bacterium]|nr:rhamnulokinase [Paludibacteraceae bacterium]